MRCLEFRETMGRFLDGEVDDATRREVGLHLVECDACAQLIEGDKFWDDAVLALLEREAPTDLRAKILVDTIGAEAARGSGVRAGGSKMSLGTQLGLIRWAATRRTSPRSWLEAAAIVAGIFLYIHFTADDFRSPPDDAFALPGEVTLAIGGQILSPESPLKSGSLSLEGPLF